MPAKLCAPLWLAFYRCENRRQPYLEIADMRNVYPLVFFESGLLEKAMSASDEQLASAARQIKMIYYKTVSVVDFETALRAIS